MKHRFAVVGTLIIVLSAVVGGFMGRSAAAGGALVQNSPNQFLSDLTEALDVVEKNYVDKVSSDKLVYSAIKGMLRALDPHSSFFDPKDFARLREDQHSKYFGLGIRVRALFRDRGRVVIVEPPALGSPAERRGLLAGDVITRIEGESIDDWTSDQVVNHLRGPRGTTVNITVERPGVREPLKFKVDRDEIPLITVPYAFEVKPGVGFMKIDRFSESTATELKEKLKKLNAEGELNGLILDLRDNPGGLLNQAIDVADFFIPRGEVIVSTKGRDSGSVRPYRAPSLVKVRVPLVVLVNRHSASASEIVAGALQDHDRALIVGETSFGKGLVQSVYPLDNNTGMALTTAKYYTPSGRLIQRDYSGSSFDYYYLNSAMSAAAKDREVKFTNAGRKVLGGGGIAPDVEVPMRELNRFEALLTARDVFFEYARRLNSGQVPAASSFRLPLRNDEVGAPAASGPRVVPLFDVTDAILANFKEYLRSRNIDFTDEQFQENVDFVKRRIRQEVYTSSFGLQEGFKIAIEGDTQVRKALELLPEAKALMTNGRMSAPIPNPEAK